MPAHRNDVELDAIEAELADLELADLERDLDVEAGLVPPWARRGLLPHERAAGVNFAELDASVVTRVDRITALLRSHRGMVADAIVDELGRARTPQDVGELLYRLGDPARPITADIAGYRQATEELTAAIEVELVGSHIDGLDAVAAEAASQGVPTNALDNVRRGALDPAVTGRYRDTANRIAASPARIAVDAVTQAGEALPVYAQDLDRTRAQLETSAREDRAAGLDAAGRTPAQQAQAAGRAQATELLPAAAYYYASELLDTNTCGPCSLVDGREYLTLDKARADYPEGLYRSCSGGPRCRGTLVTVWDTEAPPTPPSAPPKSGPAAPAPAGPPARKLPTVALPNAGNLTLDDVVAAYPGAATIASLEGERFAITGGAIHGTDVYDSVGTVHRGRLITVERSRPGYPGTLTDDEVEARLKLLTDWTDTVPDRLTGSIETVHGSLGQSAHWGADAAATSNGPEVVVWSDGLGRTIAGRTDMDTVEGLYELLDHESGHSAIAYLNESLNVTRTGKTSGLYPRLDEARARRLIEDVTGHPGAVPEYDRNGAITGFRELKPGAPPPLTEVEARRKVTTGDELTKITDRMTADGIPLHRHLDEIDPYIDRAARAELDRVDALRGRLIPEDELTDGAKGLRELGAGNRTTPGRGWADATKTDGDRLAGVAAIEEELIKNATGSRILARIPRRLFDADKAEELDKVLKAIKGLRRADKREAMRLARFTETGRPQGSFPIKVDGVGDWSRRGADRREYAVTNYGASQANGVEDWAESVRLYLRDRRDGGLGTTGYHGDRIRFADLFPARARMLDALYGPA